MDISIIGSGYVGLCTAVGFASLGHKVICVDVEKEKVDKINHGVPTIYEDGLEARLKAAVEAKQITATTDTDYAVKNSEISFIAVGTPSKDDGSIDLTYVKKVSRELGKALRNKDGYHVIAVKSTVVPGTTDDIVIPELERHSGKKAGEFGVCMVPEFLREGKALHDFLNPDRIVIGELDKKSGDIAEKIHEKLKTPILRKNIKTAEMIKYASNTFLAAKISLINEIGNICKKLGIDVYDVAEAVGYDRRIGKLFLEAGIGFGGSCFRKDISALLKKADQLGCEPKLIKAMLDTNKGQPLKIIELLEKKTNVKGKKIAVLGLSFKAGTDDVRDSPAAVIIKELTDKGAFISAYDPNAVENMRKRFPGITYADIGECLDNADACLILTDWDEFRQLEDRDFDKMRNRIILEGRRVLGRNKVRGFEGVAW